MASAAPMPGSVDPARALQAATPTALERRSTAALALAAQRALPVVARSIAAGLTVLAAERAVRNLVTGAATRVLPVEPARPAQPPRVFSSYTETTVVERFRVRR